MTRNTDQVQECLSFLLDLLMDRLGVCSEMQREISNTEF